MEKERIRKRILPIFVFLEKFENFLVRCPKIYMSFVYLFDGIGKFDTQLNVRGRLEF